MAPTPSDRPRDGAALDGLRVVEVGDTIAAAAAGAVFRRLGAQVTKLRVSDDAASQEGTQIARLRSLLDRDKTVVQAPDVLAPAALDAASNARVTVCDLGRTDYWSTADALVRYEQLVAQRNTGIWVTVLPFGLHGPRCRSRGSELTIGAAGGVVYHMRSSEGRPMKPAGFTASITGGHFAALAAFHGLLLTRDAPDPLHLDLSLQDSVVVSSVFLECAHLLFECPGPGGIWRHHPPSGMIPCKSGMIWIVAIEEHHWLGIVRALGDPPWAAGIRTSEERQKNEALILEEVTSWAAQHSARDAARRLQAEGVPATSVNSARDLLDGEDLEVRRGFFGPGGGDPRERLPGIPALLTPRSSPAAATVETDSGASRPNRRVLDLTHVLAGPLATSWLAAMGVDVLKVEDPDRPDLYRRIGPYMRGVRDIEHSAYFASANYSKRSFAIQLGTSEGKARLQQLVASADLVVENLGKYRADRIGLTEEALNATAGATLVSSGGFGRTVSHAAYRAYGMNIHASGGVVYLSRDRRNVPQNLGTSWGDPITSVWMAILAVVQLLQPARSRAHIDLSMVEAIAYLFPEYFSVLTVDGVEQVADESRLDHAAPHGVYPCAGDDRWVAIAVVTDAEWLRLRSALGEPESLRQERFDTSAGRLASLDDLDCALESVLATCGQHELVERLQSHGVACAAVLGAKDLIVDEHLRSRELFQEVEHSAWGRGALAGLPWRIVGEGPVRIRPTPLLGEHTTDDPARWWLS